MPTGESDKAELTPAAPTVRTPSGEVQKTGRRCGTTVLALPGSCASLPVCPVPRCFSTQKEATRTSQASAVGREMVSPGTGVAEA